MTDIRTDTSASATKNFRMLCAYNRCQLQDKEKYPSVAIAANPVAGVLDLTSSDLVARVLQNGNVITNADSTFNISDPNTVSGMIGAGKMICISSNNFILGLTATNTGVGFGTLSNIGAAAAPATFRKVCLIGSAPVAGDAVLRYFFTA